MKSLFTSKLSLFLLSLSLSLSVLLGFSLSTIIGFEQPIRIVDLTVMDQTEVLAWAQEQDLIIETIEAYDEESSIGSILSQDITVGERLFAGSTITLTISKGPDPDVLVEVGDFSGKDIGEIQSFIDLSKLLNAKIEFSKSEDVDSSFLISQSIKDASIKRSDLISFVISTGDKESLTTVLVHDFSTYTQQQINTWASSNNISIHFIEEFNSSVAQGTVFSQSLTANQEIYDGSSLTIKISKGTGVVLENLVGKTKTDIDKFVSDNGLKVSFSTSYSSSRNKDTAISQTPSASTRVESGSSVSVVLSLGKVQVTNYSSKTLPELQAWITEVNKLGANLKISSSTVYNADVTSGKIISQSPSTGEVNPGSTITATVSKGTGVTVRDFNTRTDTQEGLNISTVERYSSSAVGTVLSQSISSGTVTDTGSSITLTVSKGSVSVSSKIGGTLADLQAWVNAVNAEGADLRISSSEAYTANQTDKGKITTQTPSSGTVSPGSTITAVISKGTQVTVNTFVGTTSTTQTGLRISVSEAFSSTVADNVVISQSVTAGTPLDYDSSMSIVVSKGQDPATLPTTVPYISDIPESINSSNLADYQNAIRARFSSAAPTLNLTFATTSDNTSCGMVRSVNPGQGTTVNGGTTVTVTLDTNGCN